MNEALFEKGLNTRHEVLGSEYVDSSIKNADEFTLSHQLLGPQRCWADVWNRLGMSRDTPSFLGLAMLSALNRPHEIKLHIHGALNNGMTKEEIKETFLQAAIYRGAPAATESFRSATGVFKEVGV